MEKNKWFVAIMTLLMLVISFGTQHVTYADDHPNLKIEYDDNSLQPTKSTGFPPKKDQDEDKGYLKWIIDKTKDLTAPAIEAVKGAVDFVSEKANEGWEWAKETTEDGLQAMGDWWDAQNAWVKSAVILGGGAVVLLACVLLTPLAAGSALVLGAGGALGYGMYAMTTDNISFVGGMAYMTLGMLTGGASLFLRGTQFAVWAARGNSFVRPGMRMIAGYLGKTSLISGGISGGIAGGMHVYRHFALGEPLDPVAMVKDIVTWGVAGSIAGPVGRTATSVIRARIIGSSIGAGVTGGSEYTLGNLFQGKIPDLKTTAKITAASLVLGGMLIGGTQLFPTTSGSKVSQSTIQISDSTVNQASKTTSNLVDNRIAQNTTKTIIDADHHITINPVQIDKASPNIKLKTPVAGDNVGVQFGNKVKGNISSDVGKTDLNILRKKWNVPESETVAVGKTNVKGLEDFTFVGGSPKVRKEAGLPDLDEIMPHRNIKAPGNNPLFTRHAEEGVLNEFDSAVIKAGIKPDEVVGTLRIHQSNPSGVCRKCYQGLTNDKVPPGVLKQLSLKYPNLIIEVTSEIDRNIKVTGRLNLIIKNGQYIN